ncbi:MAG: peptidylprolyl isomerase [Anaerolineales bacterium]|nr:peptidylprolyl isomerase [Anaerolineales bacterium]MCB8952497.1 peptidylprolyl isomerase [Ardenticatenales bacterium]
MKKVVFLLLTLLFLVACGASGTTQEPTAPAATTAAGDETANAADADTTADVATDTNAAQDAPATTAAPTDTTTDAPAEDLAAAVAAASMVRPDDHVRGAATDAYITIIEYSDFQCPGCSSLAPLLHQVLDAYPNDVRLIYRHFPLVNIHPNAQKAAEAAEAAGAQGQFWEYHDMLFAHQADFANLDAAGAREQFISYARELGLDVDKFTTELDDGVYFNLVDVSREEAINLSLPGTPSLFFNGEVVTGEQVPPTYYYWDAVIRLTLLEQRAYAAPPPMTIDTDATYYARVKMASGDEFVIELLPKSAPETVNNFVFLAREGWFDGITFHRVLPDFVAQTGDPTGTGFGGPGYFIPNEIDPALTHAEVGMVAMANSGADRNGSQWYITLGDVSQLDGGYTIFGRVIDGMDVVQKITPRDPSTDPEAPPGDVIESVTIEEQAP